MAHILLQLLLLCDDDRRPIQAFFADMCEEGNVWHAVDHFGAVDCRLLLAVVCPS